MLFVALLSTRPGNDFQENAAKRLQWEYPEGANGARRAVTATGAEVTC